MSAITRTWDRFIMLVEPAGAWAGLLLIRLLLAWEFGTAGFGKLAGDNWFGRVQQNFPFPFNILPVEVDWFLATWVEILGGLGLALGLFTRFWAFSLVIVTVVAIFGVHWPEQWDSLGELWQGYAVTNDGFGNYRIPLLFIAMLLPLFFFGPGKLSLDYLLSRKLRRP
jgi:putative oxidoreductase